LRAAFDQLHGEQNPLSPTKAQYSCSTLQKLSKKETMSDVTKHDLDEKLRDISARFDVEEGIRQGLEDVKKGKLRPAREFFEEFEAKHGIPKQRFGHRGTR
jgi:hypothetical protein